MKTKRIFLKFLRVISKTAFVVIFLIFLTNFILGCIIGALTVGFNLNPPLGLTLTQKSSNTFLAEWWGNNSESYFSGYVIFITTNSNELYDGRDSTNHHNKPYIKNSSGSLPTLSAPLSSTTTKYSYEVTMLPNGSKLEQNVIYYVAVSAYSSSKDTFSPLSNITNIILTN